MATNVFNIRDVSLFGNGIPKLNAVMIVHRPTGTVIQCDDTDSLDENRIRCLSRLNEILNLMKEDL